MRKIRALALATTLALGLTGFAIGCSRSKPPGDASTGPVGAEMKSKVTSTGKGAAATGGMAPMKATPPGPGAAGPPGR